MIPPDYVCYNEELCGQELLSIPPRNITHPISYNDRCRFFDEFNISEKYLISWTTLKRYFYQLFYKCSSYHPIPSLSVHSNLYQCINSSKVISQHRLVDMIQDCLNGYDESYTESCLLKFTNARLKCDIDNRTVCLAHIRVANGVDDCANAFDETPPSIKPMASTNLFTIVCDGYTDISSTMIGGRNETDETDCDNFPCNNTYTRCDGYWNCPDGADEINCELPTLCPPMHHLCFSPVTGNISCLSIKHANDGKADCLGAVDEIKFCRQQCNSSMCPSYRCWNSDRCVWSHNACSTSSGCSELFNTSTQFCHRTSAIMSFSCYSKKNYNYIKYAMCTIDAYPKLPLKYLLLTAPTSVYERYFGSKCEYNIYITCCNLMPMPKTLERW